MSEFQFGDVLRVRAKEVVNECDVYLRWVVLAPNNYKATGDSEVLVLRSCGKCKVSHHQAGAQDILIESYFEIDPGFTPS